MVMAMVVMCIMGSSRDNYYFMYLTIVWPNTLLTKWPLQDWPRNEHVRLRQWREWDTREQIEWPHTPAISTKLYAIIMWGHTIYTLTFSFFFFIFASSCVPTLFFDFVHNGQNQLPSCFLDQEESIWQCAFLLLTLPCPHMAYFMRNWRSIR